MHAKDCYCVAAYKTLDAAIEPLHDCCSFCSKICKCGDVQCAEAVLPFEEPMQEDSCSDECSNLNRREVTTEERPTLKKKPYARY